MIGILSIFRRITFYLLIGAFAGWGVQCVPEAPHLNPLDPYRSGSSANITTLQGEVLQKAEPHPPIPDCQIFLFPEGQFTLTDEQGRFSLEISQKGLHQLIANKDGFSPDTVSFTTDTLTGRRMILFLNGIPGVRKVRIFSEYIDQWWPDPVTLIYFQALVEDPDGLSDLSSVQLRIPDLAIDTAFARTIRPDSVVLVLVQEDFPQQNPFLVIGKDIFIHLQDRSNARVDEGPYHLIRIIEISPQTIEPTGLQIVDPAPTFRWQPYSASFDFTYELAIYLIQAGIPNQIFQKTKIPATQLQFQYPDSLPAGTYYWTIGVRDNLNNFRRSREAAFMVQ